MKSCVGKMWLSVVGKRFISRLDLGRRSEGMTRGPYVFDLFVEKMNTSLPFVKDIKSTTIVSIRSIIVSVLFHLFLGSSTFS